MDARPVLARLAGLGAAASADHRLLLVGIGGRGGSGKSTLAASIPEAQIVGTEEFWDGAGFELSRLRSEVLEPILHGESARYQAYSWRLRRELEEPRVVRPRGVVVVEGVCALHAMLRELYDLRIWVDAPCGLRLERVIARDGEEARSVWETRWLPSEDRYVEQDDPISAAQLIVDGS